MYVRSRDGTAELPLSPNVPLYSFISRFFHSLYPCLLIILPFSLTLSLSLVNAKEQTILLSLSLAPYLYLSSLPPLPPFPLASLRFTFTHLIFILFYSLILGASSMKSLVVLPADYVILC